MQFYAQTNIQLLNQLQREGYSKEDLVSINNTYQFAIKMFAGSYRPSRKTFIAHVVGTASILASLHAPIKIVAAGLIHSIYAEGDFGSWKRGISNAKRKQVMSVVGEEIEEYVCRYAALKWNSQNILAIRDRLDKLDRIDRDVLLIRLADQLEDNLDLSIIYCPNCKSRQKFFQEMGSIMIEMSQKIGFPTLAAELEAAFQETLLAKTHRELSKQGKEEYSFSIAPKSYRRKLPVAVYQQFTYSLNYFRSTLLRVNRKLRSLYHF